MTRSLPQRHCYLEPGHDLGDKLVIPRAECVADLAILVHDRACFTDVDNTFKVLRFILTHDPLDNRVRAVHMNPCFQEIRINRVPCGTALA